MRLSSTLPTPLPIALLTFMLPPTKLNPGKGLSRDGAIYALSLSWAACHKPTTSGSLNCICGLISIAHSSISSFAAFSAKNGKFRFWDHSPLHPSRTAFLSRRTSLSKFIHSLLVRVQCVNPSCSEVKALWDATFRGF